MNSFTETDLIAFHMHELSPRRERAVRRALEFDSALAAESHAIASTLGAFRSDEPFPLVDAAVLDRTWQRVRGSLTVLPPQPRLLHWRLPLAAGTGLALTAGVILLLVSLSSLRRPGITAPASPTVPEAAASAPVPNPLPTNSGIRPPLVMRMDTQASTTTGFRPGQAPTAPVQPILSNAFRLLPIEPGARLSPAQRELLADNLPPPVAMRQATASSPISRTASPRKSHHPQDTDFSLSAFGNFTAKATLNSSSGSGAALSTEAETQTAVKSPGVIVTFHQQFRPWLGYRLSGSYTTTSFNYGETGSTPLGVFNDGQISIGTRMVSATASYSVTGPHVKRLSTFAHAGGGLLAFLPTQATQPDSHALRPAGLAGAGLDYALSRHWSVRAEYRGVFFKGPGFASTGYTIPVITRNTLAGGPAVGLTYHFGRTQQQ